MKARFGLSAVSSLILVLVSRRLNATHLSAPTSPASISYSHPHLESVASPPPPHPPWQRRRPPDSPHIQVGFPPLPIAGSSLYNAKNDSSQPTPPPPHLLFTSTFPNDAPLEPRNNPGSVFEADFSFFADENLTVKPSLDRQGRRDYGGQHKLRRRDETSLNFSPPRRQRRWI